MAKKKEHRKTNAMRMLDTHKVAYEILEYEYIDGHHTGIHTAEQLHLNPDTVFKTLVGYGKNTGYAVFCIPVAKELDLKQAARISDNKSIELVAVKDLLEITGYMRGGCSPIGMKKVFPTYFDKSMNNFDEISVSGGLRGVQIRVEPNSLAAVINATFEDLTMEG